MLPAVLAGTVAVAPTTAAAAGIPAGGTVVLHHILTVGNGDAGANHAEVKDGDTGQSSAVDGTVQISEP